MGKVEGRERERESNSGRRIADDYEEKRKVI
jgi:hypothetical protein